MDRVLRGLRLALQSWDVLRAWPPLLLPAVAAAGTCLIVIGLLVVPVLVGTGFTSLVTYDAGLGTYALLLVALYLCTAIVVFFRVALSHCTACLLDGDETSLHHGFEIALSRLPRILAWSLLTTTVCLGLRLVADRLPVGGRLVAMAGGAAWGAATYFVVPALALEDVGPVAAVKSSARTVRGRWGEAGAGAGGIGLLTACAVAGCGVAGFALNTGLRAIGLETIGMAVFVLGALVALGVALVGSTLAGVFQTALYLYAGDGDPGDFDESDLLDAFEPRATVRAQPHPS